MAFVKIATKMTFECLSTDTKLIAGVREGSTCEETDTGDCYRFIGSGWVKDLAAPNSAGSFNQVSAVSRRLQEASLLNRDITLEDDGHYDFIEHR